MRWLTALFPGSWIIYAALLAGSFVAGGVGGIQWELGVQARAELEAQHARESDAIQQRKFGDKAAGDHAAVLAKINIQLGNAREKIASLSGRECFGDDTAGVLNTIGAESGTATTGEPAGQTQAAAAGSGLRFTTDRDAAGYIGLCRARYAEVASQVNEILDIEEARQVP